jgi:hypothetical protein
MHLYINILCIPLSTYSDPREHVVEHDLFLMHFTVTVLGHSSNHEIAVRLSTRNVAKASASSKFAVSGASLKSEYQHAGGTELT